MSELLVCKKKKKKKRLQYLNPKHSVKSGVGFLLVRINNRISLLFENNDLHYFN